MKILLIAFLLCADVCWAEQLESRTFYLSEEELANLNKGRSIYRWYDRDMPYGVGNSFMDEVRPPKPHCGHQKDNPCRHKDIRCLDCGLIVDNRYLERINNENIDKIYSMLADLHIKEMGQERYNQIYDPDNEGEVVKQKYIDDVFLDAPM